MKLYVDELPKSCSECDFCIENYRDCKDECVANNYEYVGHAVNKKVREEHCPLILLSGDVLSRLNEQHISEQDTRVEKVVALAVNTKSGLCTCIISRATYEELKSNFALYEKRYRATNWDGCDDVVRTLALEGLKLVDNEHFNYADVVSGVDHDMGHQYSWVFNFDTVYKVEAKNG